MGHLGMRGPKTEELVSTSIRMNREQFDDRSIAIVTVPFQCPSCGEMHSASKDEGEYIDD